MIQFRFLHLAGRGAVRPAWHEMIWLKRFGKEMLLASDHPGIYLPLKRRVRGEVIYRQMRLPWLNGFDCLVVVDRDVKCACIGTHRLGIHKF